MGAIPGSASDLPQRARAAPDRPPRPSPLASQETWASVCTELRSCFPSQPALPAPPPHVEASDEVAVAASLRVQEEAPPGSGPHEMQMLLLSTVYQLLQLNYGKMKLRDLEGLLTCLHSMYEQSHAVVCEALGLPVDPSAPDAAPAASPAVDVAHLASATLEEAISLALEVE